MLKNRQVLARLRAFYDGQAPDRAFAIVRVPYRPWGQEPTRPWQDKFGLETYREDVLAAVPVPRNGKMPPPVEPQWALWQEYLEFRMQVQDDWVPTMTLNAYSQALWGAVLGAEPVFTRREPPHALSSMTKPLGRLDLHSLEAAVDRAERHPWAQRLIEDLQYVSRENEGRFGINTLAPIDSLNLAEQLMGSNAYVALYDHPDELHVLMELGQRLGIKLVELQRRIDGLVAFGGVFDHRQGWIPGTPIPMSVDTYNVCRPGTFAQFGRRHQQALVDHFGGGCWHVHGNGWHLLKDLGQMRNATSVVVADDGSPERPIEALERLRRDANCTPLHVACTREELWRGIEHGTLPGGTMYWPTGVEAVSEANEIMQAVREYRVQR